MMRRYVVIALACSLLLSGTGWAAEDETFIEAVGAWSERTGLSPERVARDFYNAEMADIAADGGIQMNAVVSREICSTEQGCKQRIREIQRETRARRVEARRLLELVVPPLPKWGMDTEGR